MTDSRKLKKDASAMAERKILPNPIEIYAGVAFPEVALQVSGALAGWSNWITLQPGTASP